MSSRDAPDFSSAEAKLQKPAKQSAFEKQKAEAEAKRQREAAETAAVYEDFVKSFDHGSDDVGARSARDTFAHSRSRPGYGSGGPSVSVAPKRHFGTSGLKSGPGSLGPPPAGFSKKRSFGDFSRVGPGAASTVTRAFDASDDEEMGDAVDRAQEKAIARPTLRLSNLPPGTSPAMIKALLPDSLVVENIKIQPPSGPGGSERRCTVAIVTLSKETPAAEMDAAVSLLQNRYVGCGCYLSLHRHLSSAVSSSTLPSLTSSSASSSSSNPFGAKPVGQGGRPGSRDRHSRPGFHRQYAPPSSYGHHGGVSRSDLLYVPVRPPQDIRTVQLINKVIEGVLEHGLEFEALLMSRAEVQREEKWAWLWDARSQGGVWYRWTLWEVITGSQASLKKGRYVPLFEDSHAWRTPEKRLPYEFSTRLDEFVSDPEYNSSDDEDFEEGNNEGPAGEEEKSFLNPLDKAKLVHLLARLPTALSKVRKGDIARVTAFAITHVSRGVDEVVDLIISNVVRPLSLTGANPSKKSEPKEAQAKSGTDDAAAAAAAAAAGEAADASAASLVGLYVVSDILSSSSTSTVRHAWRYRQLFETALREHKVFEHLGMMADKNGWGRLRAEKWKRSVHLVLDLWEGWCVFPAESQTFFTRTFENQPLLKEREKAEEDSAKKGKWKTVEVNATNTNTAMTTNNTTTTTEGDNAIRGEAERNTNPGEQDDVDGEPIEEDDVAGEPIDEDDIEGEPIDEGDVEGEPIDEDDVAGEPMVEDEVRMGVEEDGEKSVSLSDGHDRSVSAQGPESTGRGQPRRRMRAVDMFADSDHSDSGR
ncbi:U2 snRNP-associated SURP motif-containing protein [Escovopsis weberi]|uniref:U2 snRNP-associated SURP motif-containing protein n=1 Tax=Escovopsis weberi TaxID=150374 RepID=A0A0N0RTJ1_ESCWE|nr:U2 snRNP-associated SURP motif-containing protein [Escovopsis weberi]